MPLDDQLRESIELARKIQNKRSALKRQYQFIGKLLRARDPEPIYLALAELDLAGQHSIQRHHQAENWRDRIIDEGNTAIDALLAECAVADRQKLRQLWRNHRQAKNDARRIQQARQIYREIFQALGG